MSGILMRRSLAPGCRQQSRVATRCALRPLRSPACTVQRRTLVQQTATATLLCCASSVYAKSISVSVETDASFQCSDAVDSAFGSIDASHLNNPPTYVTAQGRVVAIGDLHGDYNKAVRSLQLAGVMKVVNGNPKWVGEDAVVVQLGDVLDRGDSEIAIVMLLRELDEQARSEGGAVYMLNGNHESLNICGDYRYVTEGAFYESALVAGMGSSDMQLLYRCPPSERQRRLKELRNMVYLPGQPMAHELARNPTVLVVNDTVFAHGGLTPQHVEYGVERINREVAAWMRAESMDGSGEHARPPYMALGSADSVMWNRQFSRERWNNPVERFHACNMLKTTLAALGATRLVVGHTPQLSGCNSECDGRVWRVDVGMSQGVLNAGVQVLDIAKDRDSGATCIKVLADTSAALGSYDEDSAVDL